MTFHLTCLLHKLLKAEIRLTSLNSSNLYADLSFNYRKLNEIRVCSSCSVVQRLGPRLFNHLTRQQLLAAQRQEARRSWARVQAVVFLSGYCQAFVVCVINTHLNIYTLYNIYLQFSLLSTQDFLRYTLYIDDHNWHQQVFSLSCASKCLLIKYSKENKCDDKQAWSQFEQRVRNTHV